MYMNDIVEESINNLKNYVEIDVIYKRYKNKECYEADDFEKFCINHCIDIDILISDYARQKQINEELKNKVKELEEKNITLKNFTSSIFNDNFEKKFISKQKIKDKIDEINKTYEESKNEYGESEYYYPDYTITILEELIKEEDK